VVLTQVGNNTLQPWITWIPLRRREMKLDPATCLADQSRHYNICHQTNYYAAPTGSIDKARQ